MKTWVILQPQWAVNAVYKIIDDTKIQKQFGHILLEDFNRLWADSIYKEHHLVLKEMLKEFKVAFPKKHKTENYIFPALLESIPDNKKWSEEEYLIIEYEYNFIPRGLIN